MLYQMKRQIIRQGGNLSCSWTEVEFIVNLPEGLTLIINLTSEKEQYTKVNCINI